MRHAKNPYLINLFYPHPNKDDPHHDIMIFKYVHSHHHGRSISSNPVKNVNKVKSWSINR